MNITNALTALGVSRVIWVDDHFNNSPNQLADMLVNNPDTSKNAVIPELKDLLENVEYDSEATRVEVAQTLADLPTERQDEIREMYFEQEEKDKHFAGKELSTDVVKRACALLNIREADQWTFADASTKLAAVCGDEGGDAAVSYMIDLNESIGGNEKRGLEVLRNLKALNSKGTAFILTHEATINKEAEVENALRDALDAGRPDNTGVLSGGIPVCVIAKERLLDDAANDLALENALSVAIKRAGLRRSVHEVLSRVGSEIQGAFDKAAAKLLEIPPEDLDRYVVDRGTKEGLSELHVVERALTAQISQALRELFAKDAMVQASTARLRLLRNVQLASPVSPVHPNLEHFRKIEVWESDDLINGGYAPVSCGDVFELDLSELAKGITAKKFLVLGQPCDVAMRSDGKRYQNTAFFVPLKVKTVDKKDPKEPLLPFKVDGVQWACDFRNTTNVNLSILDLASFRTDGRVRVDLGQSSSPQLLAGQQHVFLARTQPSTQVIDFEIAKASGAAGAIEPASHTRDPHRLTFATEDAFKYIHSGIFKAGSTIQVGDIATALPPRITWSLRRCGRIRMPYAAAMLNSCVSVISREAFDLDFTYEEPSVASAGTIPVAASAPLPAQATPSAGSA